MYYDFLLEYLQRSAKVFVRGCEKFVLALPYLFCPALPGSCLVRFAYFLADLSITQISHRCQREVLHKWNGHPVQSSPKRYVNLAKQDPGRAGQNR